MKIYLVGGAVRDTLLGLVPKDKDFVVVGANEKEMLDQGYEKVGAHFPVFLDPKTKNQYALARKEVKSGSGYLGFKVFTENVSLEEDLFRRDITINAMAFDKSNNLIDPYGGLSDLNKKILKHVSSHFSEDPLRVLRVARFAARYDDFSIHEDTKELMRELVKKESTSLVPERVYSEFEKAFEEFNSEIFFKELMICGFFKEYFKINQEIQLHENWKILNFNQKWAFLLSKYPQIAKVSVSSYQKKLANSYNHFLALPLDYGYSTTWNFIKKLRLLNHLDEIGSELTLLLDKDQNLFLNFLVEVAREFNGVDKSSFEKSLFLEILEEEKRKAWEIKYKQYGFSS